MEGSADIASAARCCSAQLLECRDPHVAANIISEATRRLPQAIGSTSTAVRILDLRITEALIALRLDRVSQVLNLLVSVTSGIACVQGDGQVDLGRRNGRLDELIRGPQQWAALAPMLKSVYGRALVLLARALRWAGSFAQSKALISSLDAVQLPLDGPNRSAIREALELERTYSLLELNDLASAAATAEHCLARSDAGASWCLARAEVYLRQQRPAEAHDQLSCLPSEWLAAWRRNHLTSVVMPLEEHVHWQLLHAQQPVAERHWADAEAWFRHAGAALKDGQCRDGRLGIILNASVVHCTYQRRGVAAAMRDGAHVEVHGEGFLHRIPGVAMCWWRDLQDWERRLQPRGRPHVVASSRLFAPCILDERWRAQLRDAAAARGRAARGRAARGRAVAPGG